MPITFSDLPSNDDLQSHAFDSQKKKHICQNGHIKQKTDRCPHSLAASSVNADYFVLILLAQCLCVRGVSLGGARYPTLLRYLSHGK